MTIDEAIMFNSALQQDLSVKCMPTLVRAIQLGVEALRLIKHNRSLGLMHPNYLLPGEEEK